MTFYKECQAELAEAALSKKYLRHEEWSQLLYIHNSMLRRLLLHCVTNDLERRLCEHQEGYNKSCYTFTRRPVELKYSEHYHYINNAIAREKQLKGWSRKKKEALFKENWEELIRLFKSRLRQAQPDINPKD